MCIVKKWLQWVHQVQDSLTLEGIDPLVLRKTSKQIYYLFVSFSLRVQMVGSWALFSYHQPSIYRNDVNIDIENDRVSRQRPHIV